jgi:hypothetical protein
LPRQGANAILGTRSGVEPRLQFRLPFPRQFGRAARLRFRLDGIDSTVAVGVDPILHAAAGPIQAISDVESFFSLKGQPHGAIAIASKGIAFLIRQVLESLNVAGVTFAHHHRRPPEMSRRLFTP